MPLVTLNSGMAARRLRISYTCLWDILGFMTVLHGRFPLPRVVANTLRQ